MVSRGVMVDLPAQFLLKSIVLNTVPTISIVLNTGKRGARVHLSPQPSVKIFFSTLSIVFLPSLTWCLEAQLHFPSIIPESVVLNKVPSVSVVFEQ